MDNALLFQHARYGRAALPGLNGNSGKISFTAKNRFCAPNKYQKRKNKNPAEKKEAFHRLFYQFKEMAFAGLQNVAGFKRQRAILRHFFAF